ncbi:hypothetical protein ACUXV3_09935 [Roseobacteraceae bacterium NS-SX3]
MKAWIVAAGAAAGLAGCMSAADNDRISAELAATDARLPGCIQAAGITGSYTVRSEVLGHGAGTTLIRTVVPGPGVTEAQAQEATSCVNS